jgi:hypothetical protein
VPAYGCRAIRLSLSASPFGFQTGIPGVEEDQTGYEKVACGSRRQFSAKMGTHVPPCRAARGGAARVPTLKRRPLAFHSVLFSPFSQFGPYFAPTTSFAHILRSGTPIDDLFSPTRYTSKHLPILIIFFFFFQF